MYNIPAFCVVFSDKTILLESSKPGNPCGLPGLVLLGLSATAPLLVEARRVETPRDAIYLFSFAVA